jgi:hypothetical protein
MPAIEAVARYRNFDAVEPYVWPDQQQRAAWDKAKTPITLTVRGREFTVPGWITPAAAFASQRAMAKGGKAEVTFADLDNLTRGMFGIEEQERLLCSNPPLTFEEFGEIIRWINWQWGIIPDIDEGVLKNAPAPSPTTGPMPSAIPCSETGI